MLPINCPECKKEFNGQSYSNGSLYRCLNCGSMIPGSVLEYIRELEDVVEHKTQLLLKNPITGITGELLEERIKELRGISPDTMENNCKIQALEEFKAIVLKKILNS